LGNRNPSEKERYFVGADKKIKAIDKELSNTENSILNLLQSISFSL
jgi:hypothetical protein